MSDFTLTDQLTHIVVRLTASRWDLLMRLVTQPDKKWDTGGYQGRKEKWRSRMNAEAKSIELDADDIDWIRRQIINRDGGGWQRQVAAIFAGQHLLFSGLPRKPRKKPEERRHRKPKSGDEQTDLGV